MRKNRFSREPEVDPFYDMLFNMLIAFVFCFIIALLAMNPKATKTGDIPAKAEFIITLSWPDMDPNDLDLWVQGPSGESAWFRNREVDLMYLDRDDRGNSNNTIMVNGRKVINPLRQEVVTLNLRQTDTRAIPFTGQDRCGFVGESFIVPQHHFHAAIHTHAVVKLSGRSL